MTAVILTIHSIIVLALICVVLLQRSDGGALGIGGGGGGGGFMTGRGAANALTRTTSILAAGFFATSLLLAVRAGSGENDDRVIDELTGANGAATSQPVDAGDLSADDLLNSLGAEETATDTSNTDTPTTEQLIEDLGVEAPVEESAPASDAVDEPAGEVTPPAEDETPNE